MNNFIDKNVTIGKNVFIGNFSVIREDCIIGDDVTIGHLVVIEKGAVIGNSTTIQSQSHITALATIGERVYIGPNVLTTNERKISKWRGIGQKLNGPTIMDFARIGAGSIILPGVKIGKNSEIGAGSVVVHDVPDNSKFFNPSIAAEFRGIVPENERLE